MKGSRAWRIAAVLLASAIVLPACQATNGTDRDSPTREEAEQAERLLDEQFFDRLKDNVLGRLMATCADAQSVPSRAQCVNDAILAGFDETGEARRQCADSEERIICYMFGSYGYNLARRQKPDLSADYDWQDPLESLKNTMNAIYDQSIASCRNLGSGARIERCVLERFGAALFLSGEQVSTCIDMGDVEVAISCELRSHLEQTFDTALTRMENNKGIGT